MHVTGVQRLLPVKAQWQEAGLAAQPGLLCHQSKFSQGCKGAVSLPAAGEQSVNLGARLVAADSLHNADVTPVLHVRRLPS